MLEIGLVPSGKDELFLRAVVGAITKIWGALVVSLIEPHLIKRREYL